MKKYHVYGIGNALVDKEFQVEDSFFDEHNIEKGFMTLVSHEQQQQLLETLTNKVGITKKSGGGSAANTLYAISQFGGNAYFAGKVANDETGDFYVEQLGHHNIETNLGSNRDHGTTGRCLVMISPDAERTMHTYLGISEEVSVAEIDHEAIKDSEYVYIEGYLVTSASGKEAARELKRVAEEHGVKTAMTFSDPSMVEYFPEAVSEVIGTGVDLLFCNQQEAMLWTDAEDFSAACETLKQQAKQFVITRGAEGALLYDGMNFIEIDSHNVDAVDTNGAGDMFAGAFMFAITHHHDFETAGKLASLAAATTVSSFGPRLSAEEHQKILEQQGLANNLREFSDQEK
ncbi:MAG: adenosine kinase [Gammaproteobacteria bacterium]|nr:adenosine kinase [Gammaproteobacteria bacterium]